MSKQWLLRNVVTANGYLVKLIIISCIFSCAHHDKDSLFRSLYTKMSPDQTGLRFVNKLQPDNGLNILEYDYFYNGGGVAAADFNKDGLTDLFFTGNQVPSKIYLNDGQLRFRDITDASGIVTNGWCTGVSVADINNDGWQDIYVCHAGLQHTSNQLFISNGADSTGNITFAERAREFGLDYKGYSTQAAFFDYDKDDDADMYLLTHYHSKINPNYPGDKRNNGSSTSTDRLFRNNGNGTFTDISGESGIVHQGYGLGIAVSDINNDGWSDIYVANDFASDDLLYINNGDGTFSDRIAESIRHTSRYAMGCDIADINNDFLPDIFVADMMPYDNKRQKLMSPGLSNDVFNFSLEQGYIPQYSRNVLQLNNGITPGGRLSFSEIGQLAGLEKTDWSWSALFADLDNDGWKDLFVSNGIPHDVTNHDFTSYRSGRFSRDDFKYDEVKKDLLAAVEKLEPVDLPNFIFRNNGDLTFTDKSLEWTAGDKGFSNGAAVADFDNDGDLDIVTNNINAPPSLYRNNSERDSSNFIEMKFITRMATGIKVKLFAKGGNQYAELNPYRGFQSTQDNSIHFGLGRDSVIDSLQIIWTNGTRQTLKAIQANQELVVSYQSDSRISDNLALSDKEFLFNDISLSTGIDFIHTENKFEDFDGERLLPHRYSRNGPYTAVADVNGDGLEDFWISGPAKSAGKLFIQQKGGKFFCRSMPDEGYEDMGGVFFDADNDGDNDLYVVSGGNEYNPFSAPYQDRLYLNDGKGTFTRSTDAIPRETASGSLVVAEDYDKDGDQDLFVGGRVVPAKYGIAPQNLLLRNDGTGNFTDMAAEVKGNLKYAGMITSAMWADFDNDSWKDLVIAGEWTPIMFFKNHGGVLRRISLENDPITGWWFSLASGDFDNDGDEDLIAGNLGLNNKFRVSDSTPVGLYVKDFDQNSSAETILTYYINGTEYTMAGRDQLASVYPAIKKEFDNYTKFALATFREIFDEQSLKGAKQLQATSFASVYIENLGGAKFTFHQLPVEAQFSAIQDILVRDFDADGHLDALVAGNFYSADYMTGRYDASVGLLLSGDGRNSFKPVKPYQSGLFLKGDIRSTSFIRIQNKNCFIASPNEGEIQIIQMR